ncbi:MAG: biotin--[acetyl-CoA-carboxylase] ligase [Sphaerochaeta sp.]|nr:biotin--[acetyl-CoA-carboxylase] ligase [Sphaerochaeta sp.]
MSSKQQVLALLEQCKGSHISGEEIARQLQITRAAVWRAIHDLRLSGHAIEASTKIGYRLSESSDVLSEQGIRSAFTDKRYLDLPLHFHESIGSTNGEAKRLALGGAPHGTVVVAGRQTEGRGRNGKSFFSPSDSGLYVSVLLRPELDTAMALRVTSGAAVAVCRAIERMCDRRAGIKWVNDILIDSLKVCGILTEGISGFETGRIESLVVGIGVNHTIPPQGFPQELQGIAGALFPGTAPPEASRNRLAASIVEELLAVVDHMGQVDCQTEREERDHAMLPLPSECRQRKDSYLAPWGGKGGEASRVHPLPWGRDTFHFMEEYRRRSVVVGHRVRVVQGAVSYEAEATGIADDGALVVRLADGSVQHLRSGEISLRPILGSSW